MKALDIIILICLGIGAYRGFTKGFLQEITFLIALIVAVLGGFKLMDEAIKFLEPYFGGFPEILPYLAFLILFIAITIAITLLGKLVKKFLDITILGKADNLAGALLGIFKWAFGTSIILWLSMQLGNLIPETAKEGTWLFPRIVGFAPMVAEQCSGLLPFLQELFETIKASFKASQP